MIYLVEITLLIKLEIVKIFSGQLFSVYNEKCLQYFLLNIAPYTYVNYCMQVAGSIAITLNLYNLLNNERNTNIILRPIST